MPRKPLCYVSHRIHCLIPLIDIAFMATSWSRFTHEHFSVFLNRPTSFFSGPKVFQWAFLLCASCRWAFHRWDPLSGAGNDINPQRLVDLNCLCRQWALWNHINGWCRSLKIGGQIDFPALLSIQCFTRYRAWSTRGVLENTRTFRLNITQHRRTLLKTLHS